MSFRRAPKTVIGTTIGGTVGSKAGSARREDSEVPDALKHEVALLSHPGDRGDEEVRAPELQAECAGDPGHPKARGVIAASVAGRLRCPVCGSVVQRVFPGGDPGKAPGRRPGSEPGRDAGIAGDDSGAEPPRRWHFRRRRGEGECDHEGETVAHREAKTALARALGETLPEGWVVLLEERLENGRRPDVLAVHRDGASEARVAFEVQYARISRAHWRARRDDYAALGVPDYWLLGAETRWGRSRDDLRKALAGEPGQRVLYVGRFGPEGTGRIEAREAVFSLLDPRAPEELADLRLRVPPSAVRHLSREEARRVRLYEIPPKAFPLREISLRLVGDPGNPEAPTGATRRAAIFTPLDAHNVGRRREGRRRRRERAEREAAERERAAELAAAREAHAGRVVSAWDRLEEEWLLSEARSRAVGRLGSRVVEVLEQEDLVAAGHGGGPPVTARRRTGWWRVMFYDALGLAGEGAGTAFAWETVVGAFADSAEHGDLVPPAAQDPAWSELRRDLARGGMIVPAGDGRWRIPPPVSDTAPATDAGDWGRREPAPGAASPDVGKGGGRLRRFLGRFF